MRKSPWGRLAAFGIVFLALALFIPSVALATPTPPSPPEDFDYKVVNGTIEITDYLGESNVVSIPPTIEGMAVTSIGEMAFSGYDITSVTIPTSVINIGDYAFSDCTQLASLSLPSSIATIREGAFSSCTKLLSITVDPANTRFTSENGILYDKAKKTLICCPGGKTGAITVPSGITGISNYAFCGCARITSVTLPGTLVNIGESAFMECDALTSVRIPASVKVIDISAFMLCDRLSAINVDAANPTYCSSGGILYNEARNKVVLCPSGKSGTVSLPGSVTAVGGSAFVSCTKLTGISLPSSITTIGDMAFAGCAGISSITIPAHVKDFGMMVFGGCTKLSAVTLQSGLTQIPDGAFMMCTALRSITVPASVTSVGSGAFYACSNLTRAYFQGLKPSIEVDAFEETSRYFALYYHISRASSWVRYSATAKQAYCFATINALNGTAAVKKIANVTNGHIAAPAAPVRAGYAFVGWYRNSACTTAWKFSTDVVTNDVALFAKWKLASPAAPSGVKAAAASITSVKLTWKAPLYANGYEVYRATSASGKYVLAGSTTATSFTNASLTTGRAYYFKVRAYRLSGTTKLYGAYCAAVSAVPAPVAPVVKTASASYNSVKLSWAAVPGAAGYEIIRSTVAATGYAALAKTTAPAYTNTGLVTGKPYYYRVRAYCVVGGTKVFGAYCPAATGIAKPAVPTGVKAERVSATSIKVSWTKVDGATGYELWRRPAATGSFTLINTTSALYYQNIGLKTGNTYYYEVRAYRLVGTAKVYSAFSTIVALKP